ncbi:hypothetical protein ES703_55804 [subsurface metagenome]
MFKWGITTFQTDSVFRIQFYCIFVSLGPDLVSVRGFNVDPIFLVVFDGVVCDFVRIGALTLIQTDAISIIRPDNIISGNNSSTRRLEIDAVFIVPLDFVSGDLVFRLFCSSPRAIEKTDAVFRVIDDGVLPRLNKRIRSSEISSGRTKKMVSTWRTQAVTTSAMTIR